MVRITNIVCSAYLGCPIDVEELAGLLDGVKYEPNRMRGLSWKPKGEKKMPTFRIYPSGKMVCFGIADIDTIQPTLEKFADFAKNLGFPRVSLSKVKIVTMSAVHDMKQKLHLSKLANSLGGSYEPELFPGLLLRAEGLHYTIHHTGKVIITGVKALHDLDNKVWPTILMADVLNG